MLSTTEEKSSVPKLWETLTVLYIPHHIGNIDYVLYSSCNMHSCHIMHNYCTILNLRTAQSRIMCSHLEIIVIMTLRHHAVNRSNKTHYVFFINIHTFEWPPKSLFFTHDYVHNIIQPIVSHDVIVSMM